MLVQVVRSVPRRFNYVSRVSAKAGSANRETFLTGFLLLAADAAKPMGRARSRMFLLGDAKCCGREVKSSHDKHRCVLHKNLQPNNSK